MKTAPATSFKTQLSSGLLRTALVRLRRHDSSLELAAAVLRRTALSPDILIAHLLTRTNRRLRQRSIRAFDRSDLEKLQSDIHQLLQALHSGNAPEENVRTLLYAQAMLAGKFSEAYTLWSDFHNGELSQSPVSCDQGTIALVLPGTPSSDAGDSIEAHDFVGRTTRPPSEPEHHASQGARSDFLFVNIHNAKRLLRQPAEASAPTSILPRKLAGRSTGGHNVRFEIDNIRGTTTPFTYITLRVVDWCLRQGLRPTLYHADFYLSEQTYLNPTHHGAKTVNERASILWSYFSHDLFFAHDYLRKLKLDGVIHAEGTLAELLDLDGPSFAARAENHHGTADH